MIAAKTYYIAELVCVVEGPVILKLATTLANALDFPLERIGHLPLVGGNTGVLVLWETAATEVEAARKAEEVCQNLENRGGPMVTNAGLSELHLYVMDTWQPIASSLAGGVQ